MRPLAKVDSRAWRVALLAALAGLLTCLLCVSAPTAFADPADSSATTASEDYEPGTIPILRLTFHDDVDPDTGEVTLTGDVITIMKAPEREGYTFTYWKGSEYHPGDEYTVTGDHTLTAQWEKNSSSGDDSTDGDDGKNATPKTGDGALLFIALFAAAASSALVLANLRIRRRN